MTSELVQLLVVVMVAVIATLWYGRTQFEQGGLQMFNNMFEGYRRMAGSEADKAMKASCREARLKHQLIVIRYWMGEQWDAIASAGGDPEEYRQSLLRDLDATIREADSEPNSFDELLLCQRVVKAIQEAAHYDPITVRYYISPQWVELLKNPEERTRLRDVLRGSNLLTGSMLLKKEAADGTVVSNRAES